MNKYLLFGYDYYYPSGGMGDLIIKFNTIDEFLTNYKYTHYDQFELVHTIDDFAYETFESSIKYHHGKDDLSIIMKKREHEFIDWIRLNVR